MPEPTLFDPSSISMTSREIAELVQSRHDNVKRSIARLVEQGVIAQPPSEVESYVDGSGRTVQMQVYSFAGDRGKRDSIVVVAQLSPEFTARLVDRWRELEEAVSKPKTPGDALVQMALAYRDHERRIMAIEAEQERTKTAISNLLGGDDNVTAKGFAREIGCRADREFLNLLGRRASAMCKSRGIRPGRVTDELWGQVNSYPREIMQAAYFEVTGGDERDSSTLDA